MPRDVAVVFVHGINAASFDYSVPMRERLRKALPRRFRQYAKYKSVFWADIVRGRSQLYLEQAKTTANIVDNRYRRFIVEGLGDAAAYQKTRNRENSAYYQIQERITHALRDAEARDDPERPLIFVGHSLGCHIISSYAWDINRLKQMSDADLCAWNDPIATTFCDELRSATPFRRLDTFAGFVTLGSNMPLFTFIFGPDKVFPISRHAMLGQLPAFPGSRLSETTTQRARWLNFYSRNDLLGYPLKPLNSAYFSENRLSDREVCSEGYLRRKLLPSAFNALPAHLGYWTTPTVIRETARFIQSIIEADDLPPTKEASVDQVTTS
ncbi:MAG: hypothetical protein ACKVP3_24080 [Hyphomicrobiaceae bacterium]